MSNIILIGFKNSGKTSVGKALAGALKKTFLDTDRVVEQDYFNLTQTKKIPMRFTAPLAKLIFENSKRWLFSVWFG